MGLRFLGWGKKEKRVFLAAGEFRQKQGRSYLNPNPDPNPTLYPEILS